MIPINVKTTYSFLQSIINIDDLIEYALFNKLKYLFICDINMFGVMEFIKKCELNDIKPIIGVDFKDYLLFAKNYNGYVNLMKLSTLNSTNSLNRDDLIKYSSDLICIFMNKDVIKDYNDVFLDKYINCELDYDLLKVDARSVRCLDIKKMDSLKYLYLLKNNLTISSTYNFNYDFILNDNNKYEDNLRKIVNSCNIELPKYKLNLPKYSNYNNTSNMKEDDYLFKLSIMGLEKRLNGNINDLYKNRLLNELNVIKEMGFSNYFLIVYDYIKYAKLNNILVGPGRGSAASSLVAYSLGITEVDPIKYNLLFERFLNKDRITMPDIDTDFPDNEREIVIDYVINKYGSKNVALISTFSTFGAKNTIRDMGRVLNVPNYNIDLLCKMIGNNEKLDDVYHNNIKFKGLIDSDKKLKDLFNISRSIEGNIKNNSIHAAGIIMSNDELDNYVPLVFNGEKYVSSYESIYLEDLGLLKMDFLGLRNLTVIEKIIELVNNKLDKKIKFNDIDINDKSLYSVFKKGETLGIFQFEGLGMQKFLKELAPDTFMDISNASAIFRPGPNDSIPLFIERKNKGKTINYYDPRLEDILKDTYGIIIYQEQIMLIAVKMANYTLSEADILRRAMSKKKLDVLEKEKIKFIEGSIKNGYTRLVSEKVYELILKFASYGFPKGHSIAYSIISTKLAYLKANYRIYFYVSILNNSNVDDVKINEYIKEIKKNDIKIIKPSLNNASIEYEIINNKIVLPLTKIKGITKNIILKILNAKKDNFIDIYDIFSKLIIEGIDKDILEKLILSGTMDDFGYNRNTLINNLDTLINYGILTKKLDKDFVLKPEIVEFDEFNKIDLINKEKELFGIYITNHPVSEYLIKDSNSVNINNIDKYLNKNIRTYLMIDSIREIITKNKDKMAFVNCSSYDDNILVVLFPKEYEMYNKLKVCDIIKVEGKVEKRNDYQIIASSIERLNI